MSSLLNDDRKYFEKYYMYVGMVKKFVPRPSPERKITSVRKVIHNTIISKVNGHDQAVIVLTPKILESA